MLMAVNSLNVSTQNGQKSNIGIAYETRKECADFGSWKRKECKNFYVSQKEKKNSNHQQQKGIKKKVVLTFLWFLIGTRDRVLRVKKEFFLEFCFPPEILSGARACQYRHANFVISFHIWLVVVFRCCWNF